MVGDSAVKFSYCGPKRTEGVDNEVHASVKVREVGPVVEDGAVLVVTPRYAQRDVTAEYHACCSTGRDRPSRRQMQRFRRSR